MPPPDSGHPTHTPLQTSPRLTRASRGPRHLPRGQGQPIRARVLRAGHERNLRTIRRHSRRPTQPIRLPCRPHLLLFGPGAEYNIDARLPRPPRASGAVHEALLIQRESVVQHHIHTRDIQAASCYVCSHEHLKRPITKRSASQGVPQVYLERPAPPLAQLPAGQRLRVHSTNLRDRHHCGNLTEPPHQTTPSLLAIQNGSRGYTTSVVLARIRVIFGYGLCSHAHSRSPCPPPNSALRLAKKPKIPDCD